MTDKKHDYYEYLAFVIVLLAVHLVYGIFQENLSVHNGLGWDGRLYYQMGVQSLRGEEFAQRSPFVYRQLLPWLAAFFTDSQRELLFSFRNINLVAATITAFLILIFMRNFVADWRIRVAVAALYPLHYLGHIRKIYWYAISTDVLMILAVAIGLIMMQKIRNKPTTSNIMILALICFIAGLNRFSSLMIPIAALLCLQVPNLPSYFAKIIIYLRLWKPLLLLPVLGLIIAYVITHRHANVTGYFGEELYTSGGSYLVFVMDTMYKKSFCGMIHSILLAVGPMIVLVLWQWRKISGILNSHWHFSCMIIFALVYGIFSEHDRFIMIIMPIYAIFLGVSLESGKSQLLTKKWLLVILIIAQLISQRVFWLTPSIIPDEPSFVSPDTPIILPFLFTAWTDNFLYYDMTVWYSRSHSPYAILSFVQYMIFIIIGLIFLNAPSMKEIKAHLYGKIKKGVN